MTYYNFEISEDVLLASWPSYVKSESPEFFDSVLDLFRLIREKDIKHLLVDSGTPAGGGLTEEVIHYIEAEVFQCCPLQKVALLESVDFLWDNNMVQLINYLITAMNLDVQFRMFHSKEIAVNWLHEPC